MEEIEKNEEAKKRKTDARLYLGVAFISAMLVGNGALNAITI